MTENMVTRLPYVGVTDALGATVDSYAAPESIHIYIGEPGASTDPRRPGHERTISTADIYAPYTTPLAYRDLVLWQGTLWHVDADPERWPDHTGIELGAGAVVHLRAVV